MIEFDLQRCTRRCAASGREFAAGEEFYSALVPVAAQVERRDYAVEAWSGPPEGALGWWRSRLPTQEPKRRLAPGEVLLHLFEEVQSSPEPGALAYVLALLLVRRRVLRLVEERREAGGEETLVVRTREDEEHRVRVVPIDGREAAELESRLASLLFSEPA